LIGTNFINSPFVPAQKAYVEVVAKGIAHGHQSSNDTTWDIWADFGTLLQCDPYLDQIDDPIPLLQVFAHRYRVGALAPSGSPVRSQMVEGAL
jgi:hypothetical protein